MFLDYLAYDISNKKMFICDDKAKATEQYPIGKCFIDFMELDFSEFATFYSDVEKMFDIEYSRLDEKESVKRISINTENATNFFIKYPILRQEALKDIISSHDSNSGNTLENINVSDKRLEQYFNFVNKPKELEIDELLNLDSEYSTVLTWLEVNLETVHDLSKLTWKFIFKYNNPYICNLESIIKHPYIRLSYDDISDYSIVNELKPHVMQDCFLDAFTFCFDIDFSPELNLLTASERLFLFNSLWHGNYINFSDLKTEYRIVDSENNLHFKNIFYKSDNNSFLEWFKKNNFSDDIDYYLRSKNTHIMQLYPTYKLDNIVGVEFQKMIECDVKIKKCKNCNQYFLLKGDYATEYCDRIPDGERSSCKKIAAIRARKKKVNNNPILKEYEKAYKRMYARLSSGKISNEDFRLWAESASQKRDLALSEYSTSPSDDIINQFKEYLGNK